MHRKPIPATDGRRLLEDFARHWPWTLVQPLAQTAAQEMRLDHYDPFLAKVLKTPTCWLWLAAPYTAGYGAFRPPGAANSMPAHRYAFERVHGPASGLELHHVCLLKLCVRPEHLVPLCPTHHHAAHAQIADNPGARKLAELVARLRADG